MRVSEPIVDQGATRDSREEAGTKCHLINL